MMLDNSYTPIECAFQRFIAGGNFSHETIFEMRGVFFAGASACAGNLQRNELSKGAILDELCDFANLMEVSHG